MTESLPVAQDSDLSDVVTLDRIRGAKRKALLSLLALPLLLAFLWWFGDFWYVLVLSPLIVLGSVRFLRELRQPDRLLEMTEGEIVKGVLSGEILPCDNPVGLEAPVEELILLQRRLDRLDHQQAKSWIRQTKVGIWASALGVAGWSMGGIAALVFGPDPGTAFVCFGMATLFGLGGHSIKRGENRRKEAIRLLEDRIAEFDGLRHILDPPPSV